MFEAVIFDWDGTLADTREVILASFHEALREVAKLDVPDEFVERRIGIGATNTFREILNAKGASYNDELLRQLVEVKIRVEVDRTGDVQLFPGARQLLESLRGKVKIALASMNNRAVIEHMLKVLQVQSLFSVILTGDEVAHSKPEPEIFLKSAQKLGIQPQKTVVLEDSIFGVKAAKAGKMACIAVAQGAYSRKELARSKPDLILNSLLEKDEILKFILK
jgi:HAD superfamily hydrolase (TIGR01509 family)